jgi:hypothetical protein
MNESLEARADSSAITGVIEKMLEVDAATAVVAKPQRTERRLTVDVSG